MLIVRPACPADLGALMDLAILSGPGFTSLPEDERTLAERLEISAASFEGSVVPAEAWYTLMLEDSKTGRIEGVSAVRAAVGLKRPHFSFRVMTLAQHSSAIGTRFDHQVLVLANECAGWTEVGSLYLRPERRSGGAGSLLARARYLLMAADRTRFADTVMAELRGWFDEDGNCPFWQGVSSKFYRLPFDQADHMVMSTDGQFILDLAPRHPIYVELIEQAARESIGRCNREGKGALAMLKREGFAASGLIDIFDGGPTLTCRSDAVATIRGVSRRSARVGDVCQGTPALLATDNIRKFRVVRTDIEIKEEGIIVSQEGALALTLDTDAPVQVFLP